MTDQKSRFYGEHSRQNVDDLTNEPSPHFKIQMCIQSTAIFSEIFMVKIMAASIYAGSLHTTVHGAWFSQFNDLIVTAFMIYISSTV